MEVVDPGDVAVAEDGVDAAASVVAAPCEGHAWNRGGGDGGAGDTVGGVHIAVGAGQEPRLLSAKKGPHRPAVADADRPSFAVLNFGIRGDAEGVVDGRQQVLR